MPTTSLLCVSKQGGNTERHTQAAFSETINAGETTKGKYSFIPALKTNELSSRNRVICVVMTICSRTEVSRFFRGPGRNGMSCMWILEREVRTGCSCVMAGSCGEKRTSGFLLHAACSAALRRRARPLARATPATYMTTPANTCHGAGTRKSVGVSVSHLPGSVPKRNQNL